MGEFDPTGLIGGGIVAGIVLLIVWLALIAGAVWLGLWLMYTVIWRAVRRGLREYHGQGPVRPDRYDYPAAAAPVGAPATSASRAKPSRRSKKTLPLRPEPGPRDW